MSLTLNVVTTNGFPSDKLCLSYRYIFVCISYVGFSDLPTTTEIGIDIRGEQERQSRSDTPP